VKKWMQLNKKLLRYGFCACCWERHWFDTTSNLRQKHRYHLPVECMIHKEESVRSQNFCKHLSRI
jgi:hypothetical protein